MIAGWIKPKGRSLWSITNLVAAACKDKATIPRRRKQGGPVEGKLDRTNKEEQQTAPMRAHFETQRRLQVAYICCCLYIAGYKILKNKTPLRWLCNSAACCSQCLALPPLLVLSCLPFSGGFGVFLPQPGHRGQPACAPCVPREEVWRYSHGSVA